MNIYKLKNYKNTIIIIMIIVLIIILLYQLYKQSEHFSNDDISGAKTLVSHMDGSSGFYSQLLHKLNHYLYCKNNNINFKLNTENWPYKYKNGWTDYFENNDLIITNDTDSVKPIIGCCSSIKEYKMSDYVKIIPEFYKYNQKTKDFIKNKKTELGLEGIEYGSLYIRRGDKLINEINFISTDKFADKLLEIYPSCKNIFLQTDDYNCFLDLEKYVKEKGLDIKLTTLCPANHYGAISNKMFESQMLENNQNNKQYLDMIKNNLSKPISEMTPDEKYAHTMELITSVDICINSKYCVCDYKSNVARFIKLAHKKIQNVYDINLQDTDFFLNLEKPPAYNLI
jgi:hypothetical protein